MVAVAAIKRLTYIAFLLLGLLTCLPVYPVRSRRLTLEQSRR